MTVVRASLLVSRSAAGYVVVGLELNQSRPNLGLQIRVLTNPIVPQRLHQPKKSCAGVEMVAGLLRMAAVTPGRVVVVIVAPLESLIEFL